MPTKTGRYIIRTKKRKDRMLKVVPTGMKQVIKYGLVGTLNFAITFVSFKVLHDGLKLSLIFSNFAGYFLGFLNSFYMNKKWTFKSTGDIKNEAVLFILMFAAAYCAQLGFVLLLDKNWDLSSDISFFLSMIVYTLVNFTLNKFITFKAP